MDQRTMTWVVVGMGSVLLAITVGMWCYFRHQRGRDFNNRNNELGYYNEI